MISLHLTFFPQMSTTSFYIFFHLMTCFLFYRKNWNNENISIVYISIGASIWADISSSKLLWVLTPNCLSVYSSPETYLWPQELSLLNVLGWRYQPTHVTGTLFLANNWYKSVDLSYFFYLLMFFFSPWEHSLDKSLA